MEDYKVCLANSEKANYSGGISTAIANLGEINMLMGNYAAALPYQLKTISLQEQDNDLSNLTENYGHASTIYECLGNYKMALLYQKKARKMRDSTASIQSDAEMSMLRSAMDQLNVDIDTAVPLGLIVNELLTNTLKYAFPDGRKGKIQIRLNKNLAGILHLEVSDDGVGKSGVTFGTGFGGQLVSLLTRQLSGSMREEVKNGTTIYFDFNLKKAA